MLYSSIIMLLLLLAITYHWNSVWQVKRLVACWKKKKNVRTNLLFKKETSFNADNVPKSAVVTLCQPVYCPGGWRNIFTGCPHEPFIWCDTKRNALESVWIHEIVEVVFQAKTVFSYKKPGGLQWCGVVASIKDFYSGDQHS